MKISQTELLQIIKEEVDRLKKINALISEQKKIEKELFENYGVEEIADVTGLAETELDEFFGFGDQDEKYREQFKKNTIQFVADFNAKYKAAGKSLPPQNAWATPGTPEFEQASWAAAYLKNPNIYWNNKTQMYMPRQFSTGAGSTAGENQGGRGAGVDMPTLLKYIEDKTKGKGGAAPTV